MATPARSFSLTSAPGFLGRAALSLIGAAAMIAGSFLVWLRSPSYTGVKLNHRIYYKFYLAHNNHVNPLSHSKFVTSAGIVTIVLGVVAILGLFPSRGWLTSVAGILAIIAIVLFAVVVKGANVHPKLHIRKEIGVGAVVVLVGGVLALIGGFVGARRRAAVVPV